MANNQNIFETFLVEGEIEDVYQKVASSFNGTTGYKISSSRPNTIIVTRKYRPAWVWVVAGIGLLFFLLGLLALFYTETETLTVNLRALKNKTQVEIGGTGNTESVSLVNAAIAKFERREIR